MALPVRYQAIQAMGADAVSDASAVAAKNALEGMKGALRKWLSSRRTLDAYVAGAAPAGLLRNPGSRPIPPSVVAQSLRQDRFATEQDLANTLYALLVECGATNLPSTSVAVDPDAAAKLAQIVLAGKTPAEATEAVGSPQAAGFWWLLAIPVAGAVLVLSQLIKSKAETAQESERIRCIESGACTDSGFWIKVGSIAVLAYIAWEKLGLKKLGSKGAA